MADHRVLFEHDPEIGRTVWLVFNERGELRGAHVEQEVDGIVDVNRRAEADTHGRRFGDYQKIASVPLTFMEKSGLGDAVDAGDRRYLSKILNDADYAGFRTSRGKV